MRVLDTIKANLQSEAETRAAYRQAEAARFAYEADVAARPTYDDGMPRRTWDQLCSTARWSWERNPTPRFRGAADRRDRNI